MKTSIIITGVLAVGTTISSFTWIPSAMSDVREWAISPVISVMAGMKYYDIRTDELVREIKEIEDSIRRMKLELQKTPNISPDHERSLRNRIESDRKKLNEKGDKLNQSTSDDRKILATLQGLTSVEI